MRFKVRIVQAVFETATFVVDAPDQQFVLDNVEQLMADAAMTNNLLVEVGDVVPGIDTHTAVTADN